MKKAKKSKTDNESSFKMIKHVPRLFSFLHGLTEEHPQETNIPLRSVMLEAIESLHVRLSFSPFFHRKINISRQGVQVTEGKKNGCSLSPIVTMLAAAALKNMITRLAERNLLR